MQNEFTRPKRTDQIDKGGFQDDIKATAQECADLAKRFDCESIENLSATVKIKPKADKMTFHITGNFTADVTQACIISNKPIHSNLSDNFDAWYRDTSRVTPFRQKNMDATSENEEHEMRPEEEDPEIIKDGIIDMGEIVSQFLGLAINPYPKADDINEGDYIEVKPEDKPNPFAKLAALKTKE
jgi:hypothetical protein